MESLESIDINQSMSAHQSEVYPAAVYPAQGRHLLLRLSGCSFALLNDEEQMSKLAYAAATATGATVLELISRKFIPQGVTVLTLLAESHASLHTYPESGMLFWDCFTCGNPHSPPLLKVKQRLKQEKTFLYNARRLYGCHFFIRFCPLS